MEQETYKTGNQLRREKIRQERNEGAAAIGTILLMSLAALAAIHYSDRKRAVSGIGRPDGRQLTIDFDEPAAKTNEAQARADIEQAFHDMQAYWWPKRKRDNRLGPYAPKEVTYTDRETGDEYLEATVFELYKKSRYTDEPMEYVREIEGEELEQLTEMIRRYMDKAKTFGYTLYLYQDGALVDTFND